jgi:hypothetical protein
VVQAAPRIVPKQIHRRSAYSLSFFNCGPVSSPALAPAFCRIHESFFLTPKQTQERHHSHDARCYYEITDHTPAIHMHASNSNTLTQQQKTTYNTLLRARYEAHKIFYAHALT